MKATCHFDEITQYIYNEIKIQEWCRKINSKPIEYVDVINTQSIKSVKQRLKSSCKME